MEVANINDVTSFSEERLQKNSFFDSEKLFYDAYCLMPGQAQKVHTHDGSDKVYYVIQGTASFTVAGEERDLGPGNAVIARAGEEHGVRNDTADNVMLLVTMAPRPSG